jgi:hypothetical protein
MINIRSNIDIKHPSLKAEEPDQPVRESGIQTLPNGLVLHLMNQNIMMNAHTDLCPVNSNFRRSLPMPATAL